MVMVSSLIGLVRPHYVILHEYCLGTTIIFFVISTVDHTRYAHTGSCVRQKGRQGSDAIVRIQCSYTLYEYTYHREPYGYGGIVW